MTSERSRGVRHEPSGFLIGAVLVERPGLPEAFGLVLILHQPYDSLAQIRRSGRDAGLLEYEGDETGARNRRYAGLKRSIVVTLPDAGDRRSAPTAIGLLQAVEFIGQRGPLRRR